MAQPLGDRAEDVEAETPARDLVLWVLWILWPAMGEDGPTTPPHLGGAEVTGTTGGLCCIDPRCPGTDLERTGCKSGGIGPGAAYRTCEDACCVSCTSSGLCCN